MNIEDRVKKVLLKNSLKDLDPKELNFNTPLIEYGIGLDSVATLELVVSLEEEFKTSFDETKLTPETFQTISSISEHIAKEL